MEVGRHWRLSSLLLSIIAAFSCWFFSQKRKRKVSIFVWVFCSIRSSKLKNMDSSDPLSTSSRFFSSSSWSYSSCSGIYLGGDDVVEVEDDYKQEFLCPFCAEEFDIVGLFCHIDEEHHVEAKNGVCPVCAKRVGTHMVGHITTQHGNILKIHRRRLRGGGSISMFAMLRKELRDGIRQSHFGGSSFVVSSSNPDPDPLLSSFVSSSPSGRVGSGEPQSSEVSIVMQTTKENDAQSSVRLPLSGEEQGKKARKSEFVQGLLMSVMFDGIE